QDLLCYPRRHLQRSAERHRQPAPAAYDLPPRRPASCCRCNHRRTRDSTAPRRRRSAMNLGTSGRRQTITAVILGALALGACFYIYEEVFATGGSSTPAPAAVAPAPPRTPPADNHPAPRPPLVTGPPDPPLP